MGGKVVLLLEKGRLEGQPSEAKDKFSCHWKNWLKRKDAELFHRLRGGEGDKTNRKLNVA